MVLIAAVPNMNNILHQRGPNTYPSGLNDSDQGHVMYALPSSKNPLLLIPNPIYDNNCDIIMPGYYELALGYDRTMLYLIQDGQTIASFPVFKVEEDNYKTFEQDPMDKKSLKEYKKKQKQQEKKIKKMKEKGQTYQSSQPYAKATIEYDVEKNCYIIKYEKEKIRAYGMIKVN